MIPNFPQSNPKKDAWMACRTGDFKWLGRLIKDFPSHRLFEVKGPDGFTPLHWSVKRGCDKCVALLLSVGVDVNIVSSAWGKAPFFEAVSLKNLKIVELLFRAGADIDQMDPSGSTPLSMAIDCNYYESVLALVSFGADLNQKTNGGRTALHWAANKQDLRYVKLLVESGADLFALDLGRRRADESGTNVEATQYLKSLVEHEELHRDAPDVITTFIKPRI